MTNLIPYEEGEQKAFVSYLELKGYKFTAIPNSTFTRSWKQKNHNKAMGLRAGLPDLLVIINDTLHFIEMKRIKGSSISKDQKAWIEALGKCENVEAVVCKGFDEAREYVESRANQASKPRKGANR